MRAAIVAGARPAARARGDAALAGKRERLRPSWAARRRRRYRSCRATGMSCNVSREWRRVRRRALGSAGAQADALDRRGSRGRRSGFAGSKTLPSKKVSLPRDVDAGISAAATPSVLGRLAPQVLAVDLVDQRLDVGRPGSNLPQRMFSVRNQSVVALERDRRRRRARTSSECRCPRRPAAVAVVDVALDAADDVGAPAR